MKTGKPLSLLGMVTFLSWFSALNVCAQVPAREGQKLLAFQELVVSEAHNYKNLPLVVGDIPSNTANVTKEMVQTRVELKMRSIGLKPVPLETQPFNLYVDVNMAANAFNVRVLFRRQAAWAITYSDLGVGVVTTWEDTTIGTHASGAAFVLHTLDTMLDRFMNEYLKANQDTKQ